jgi:precorrin-6B methylase 2
MELKILAKEGLRPADTLVDLGCGSGRLGQQTPHETFAS